MEQVSTLGKIYSGIQNQTDGEIKINGLKANKKMRLSKVWYIPQDLDSQLFGEDLMDELLTGLKIEKIISRKQRNF